MTQSAKSESTRPQPSPNLYSPLHEKMCSRASQSNSHVPGIHPDLYTLVWFVAQHPDPSYASEEKVEVPTHGSQLFS